MFCENKGEAQVLLNLGFDIHEKDVNRNTALYYAIRDKRFELIKFFLDNGIIPQAYDLKRFNFIYRNEETPEVEEIRVRLGGFPGVPNPLASFDQHLLDERVWALKNNFDPPREEIIELVGLGLDPHIQL
jgi:ankyrin repeat protein